MLSRPPLPPFTAETAAQKARMAEDGYLLHTHNCPYHQLNVNSDSLLCDMDMRLIAMLLGVVPRRVSRVSAGDASCSYLSPLNGQ